MELISGELFAEVVGFLFAWLILATVFEEMFFVVFNWRFYKNRWDGKGFKTPIMLVVVLILCYVYSIDLFYEIIEIFQLSEEPKRYFIGNVITAMFLIGGSGTVFRVLEKIRQSKEKLN